MLIAPRDKFCGVIAAIVLLLPAKAKAFDPFTVMAVVGTGISVVSSIVDTASDATGTVDAFR